MKTSNIIFLSFLIFLFGGITLLFIGSKCYVEHYDTTKFASQEKQLPPFSVVVAESNSSIHLRNGQKRKITQSCFKESRPKFAPFVVRNDTLFIFSAKQDRNKIPHATFMVEIFCENVKRFVAKEGSIVNFSGYQVDSIFVKMNDADLICEYNNSVYIKMIAKNSRSNFNCAKLNSMEVELDKTRLDVKSKNRVNNISGTVKTSSEIGLSLDGKINLDVDKSSRMHF